MPDQTPGLYLVRNFHTSRRHGDLGAEHSRPSRVGEEEALRTSAYIQSLGLEAIVLVASPYTARSEESGNLLSAQLNLQRAGKLFNAHGLQPSSPLEIAHEEALGIRDLMHHYDIYHPPMPGVLRPAVIVVVSGEGLSEYLGLSFSWHEGEHPSP